MEDPNLVACLYPYGEDEDGPATRTIQHPQNRSRYFKVQQQRPSPSWDRSSRESTVSVLENTEDVPSHRYREGLLIRFSDELNGDLGVVLGNLGRRSYIFLPNFNNSISRRHAYLTFDPQERWLILRDCSTVGTIVKYDGQGGEKRRNFQWILGGHEVPDDTKEIIIEFHPYLKFQIVVYKHEKYRDQYFNNIDRFLATVAANAVLPIGRLGLESGNSTVVPSGIQSPSQDSILLEQETLGEGSFAIVKLVWDVSTGIWYAAKEPRRKYFNRKRWEAEIGIMRQIRHEHIVQFKFSTDAPRPRMVMEYLSLGNLEDQHEKRRFSENEILAILIQTLFALEHLHGRSIMHRDLKPQNLLLKSRDPLHVKVADFGLAKEGKHLETLCGTATYEAPEIAQYLGKDVVWEKYNEAVDIWSLGVIILRFLWGLPYPGQGAGIGWCQEIIVRADDYNFEDSVNFLKENMLVWEADGRSSAETCIREARKICIPSQSGDVTPTPGSQQPFRDSDIAGIVATSAVGGASRNEDPTVIFSSAEFLRVPRLEALIDDLEKRKRPLRPLSPVRRRSKRLGRAREIDSTGRSEAGTAENELIGDAPRCGSGSFRPGSSLTRQAWRWDQSSHRERIGWRARSTPSEEQPRIRDH